jgi:hypothetical protein
MKKLLTLAALLIAISSISVSYADETSNCTFSKGGEGRQAGDNHGSDNNADESEDDPTATGA